MRLRQLGAHMHAARHVMMYAECWRARDVAWRRVSGPFWCAEEASEETVVGWATAESSGTGCVLTTTG